MMGFEQQLATAIEAGRYNAAARTCRRASARLTSVAIEPLAVLVESSFKREWLSDICLLAQQHRLRCDKAHSKSGKTWDPEQSLSALLRSPLAAAALCEHRYVAAAALMLSKIQRETQVARDILQIMSYGSRAPGYRRYRRHTGAATLALADLVAKAGTRDRLSIDVLQRALNLGAGQETLAALLEALVQRREPNVAAEVVRRVPPALVAAPVLAPATRAHLAIRDISSRVVRQVFLPALAQTDRDLGLEISAHLCRHLHIFPASLQSDCAAGVEAWLQQRMQLAERFVHQLVFPKAWIILREKLVTPGLRLAIERSAARRDLEDFRGTVYHQPVVR